MQVAIIPSVIILSAKYAECCRATFSPVFLCIFWCCHFIGANENKPKQANVSMIMLSFVLRSVIMMSVIILSPICQL